uniref:Tudor domain-containing protein n=1 Tax=Anopheles atroparvus TaxID=41427 RepID=A0A182JG12_ANOAO
LVRPVTTNKTQHIRKMIVQQKTNGKRGYTPTRYKTQNIWNGSQPRSFYRPVDFARRNDFTTSSLDDSSSSNEEAYLETHCDIHRKTEPATQFDRSASNTSQQSGTELNTICISKSVQQSHEQSHEDVSKSAEIVAINSPTIPLTAMTLTDRLPAHQLPPSVTPESLFNTYVTSVLSPNNINVHLKYQTEMMVQIEDELEAIYGDVDPHSSWHLREEAAKEGLYCVAKYQDIWYRGMIAGPLVEQSVDVFLVDCALKVNVALSDIMHMRKKDALLPLQTMRVSLAHVKPSEGEWKEEATRFLMEAMCNKVFYMYVVDINTEDDIPDVVFIDVSTPTSIILNGELVLKKYAKWVHEA